MRWIVLNRRFAIIFITFSVFVFHFFANVQKNPKGLKNFLSFLSIPVEEQRRVFFTNKRTLQPIRPDEDFGDFYKWATFIKETTPVNSLIILPFNNSKQFVHIGHTGYCSYFLFPRLLRHEGGSLGNLKWLDLEIFNIYRVSMAGFEYKGEFLKKYTLDSNFSLVLLKQKTKEPGLQLVDYGGIPNNVFNVSFAFLKLLLIFMSGFYLVIKFFEKESVLSLLTTSFMVGLVVSTVIYILLSLIGINFTEILQFVIFGLISIPGLFCLIKHKAALTRRKNIDWTTISSSLIVGLFFLVLFMKSALTPVTAWDALAIWGAKAKSILALHNLEGLSVWGTWPQYPPLWSIALSQLGVGGEGATKLIFPLTALCLYSIIYSEITVTKYPPFLKIILPLLVIVTPTFLEHSLSGYANLALTVFVVKAVTILSRLKQDDNRNVWISLSIILCGVSLLRPEGPVYSLAIILLALAFCYLKGRDLAGSIFLLVPISCVILWFTYFSLLLHGSWRSFFSSPAFSKSKIILAIQFSNIVTVSKNMIMYFFRPRYYGIIVTLFSLFILFRGKEIIRKYFFESLFVFLLLFSMSVYSHYLMVSWGSWLLFGSESFTRYLMPAVPVMFIIILKETDFLLNKK